MYLLDLHNGYKHNFCLSTRQLQTTPVTFLTNFISPALLFQSKMLWHAFYFKVTFDLYCIFFFLFVLLALFESEQGGHKF